MRDRLARILFYISLSTLVVGGVFLWGYEAHRRQHWPAGFIEDSRLIARSLRHFHRILPDNLYRPAPAHVSPQRIAVHDPDAMAPGWYVMLGWDATSSGFAAWLYDEQGILHHTWPVRYDTFVDDEPSNGSDAPHGLLVLADGSLVVNFDHADAMARLDACGKPIWVRRGIFHHSLDIDDAGDLWTWEGQGTPYAYEHRLVRVAADSGETLESIDLLADILRGSVLAEMVLGVRADYHFQSFMSTPSPPNPHDFFHPNDVEVLDAAMAPAFPDFEAGDLLISLRNNNLVAVVGRTDHRFRWWRHGPWIRQHDPDFLPDGRISVFNNNTDRGRSELTVIDPRTGNLSNPLHGGTAHFYTATMGKHQYIPGGNVLIVVPAEGRMIVTNAAGTPVVEFNNVVEGLPGIHAAVVNGLWLPPDHFDRPPACGGP